MNAHILLNLLNETGKRDKMQGLLSILLPFRNQFNKFNNTGARNSMLDSIYHKTLKITLKLHFGVKSFKDCYYTRNVVMDLITVITLLNL